MGAGGGGTHSSYFCGFVFGNAHVKHHHHPYVWLWRVYSLESGCGCVGRARREGEGASNLRNLCAGIYVQLLLPSKPLIIPTFQ